MAVAFRPREFKGASNRVWRDTNPFNVSGKSPGQCRGNTLSIWTQLQGVYGVDVDKSRSGAKPRHSSEPLKVYYAMYSDDWGF